MTQLLELAVEAARQLAPEEQDEIARVIMEIVHGVSDEVYELSADDRVAVRESLAQADRGEFATEEEVEALFASYRP